MLRLLFTKFLVLFQIITISLYWTQNLFRTVTRHRVSSLEMTAELHCNCNWGGGNPSFLNSRNICIPLFHSFFIFMNALLPLPTKTSPRYPQALHTRALNAHFHHFLPLHRTLCLWARGLNAFKLALTQRDPFIFMWDTPPPSAAQAWALWVPAVGLSVWRSLKPHLPAVSICISERMHHKSYTLTA